MLRLAYRLLPVIAVTMLGFAGFAAAVDSPDEVPFVEGQTPPQAKPGEVWCLVTRPATYKSVSEQVCTRPETFFKQTVPAKFETRDKLLEVAPAKKVLSCTPATFKTEKRTIVTQEECFTYEVVPAVYEWVETKIVVRPAYEECCVRPAEYKTVCEQILVAPARTEWRKVDCNDKNAQRSEGKECFGLVEVPAVYQTVNKEVLVHEAERVATTVPAVEKCVRVHKKVKDAEVRKVPIAPESTCVDVTVVDVPSKVDTAIVPARSETIKEQVQVEAEKSIQVKVPAKVETVSHQVLDKPEHLVWVRTKCDCKGIVERYKSVPGCDEASLDIIK